jgi:enamine deaminase RidA (YjgF/YER057c/UK114 family)
MHATPGAASQRFEGVYKGEPDLGQRDKTFRTGHADIAYLSFTTDPGDVVPQVDAALARCDTAVGLRNVVRQVFFIAPETDRKAVEAAVARRYNGPGPVTSYVYEPPADGSPLAAEMWAFTGGALVTQGGRTSVAETGAVEWGFVGGLETQESDDPHPGMAKALRSADAELRRSGFQFKDIVRTWYYIGELLAPLENGSRYDRFNQARNEFFQDIWKDLRYSPASTGIGMKTRRVSFEGAVLKGEPGSFKVTWIDNPLQTKPFSYDISVEQKRKPSFSRAAAVTFDDAMLVYVSGTASIRKSEVIQAGDAAAQTHVTIENIATLIGEENLAGNCRLPRGLGIGDIQQFRVYVKDPADAAVVNAICEESLPHVPRVYLIADVCRSQCLVEIEAVAAARL